MITAAFLLSFAALSDGLSLGPYLGHVDHERAYVWARAAEPGELSLTASLKGGERELRVNAVASEEQDLTVTFLLDGLPSASAWTYRIHRGEEQVGEGELKTAPALGAPSKVQVAFGSCASERRFPELATFTQIQRQGCDSMVFLGDTPYIDTTDLAVQRSRYREFLGHPAISAVLGRVPSWSTWDDHDFGKNDTDGRMAGKENSRRAHLEYHAGPPAGDGSGGIYRSFRRGPVEVFLMDARWYAGTAPAVSDPERLTLLGAAQWSWLEGGLKSSTAPFKLLTTGMIWNESVRPNKSDHWGNYPHERERLFRFLGEHEISGAVLIGGDIHRSRVVRHDVEEWVGYPLVELITSPMANSTILTAKQPHPGLLFDTGNTQNFMAFEADSTVEPPRWTARFIDHEGRELFKISRSEPELTKGK
ncbi:MAG: alkaline phosphatase family protein [Planctomycetes bacterium]|nr:alkaline phosphatase family protein [Planctomycetota bacterium]